MPVLKEWVWIKRCAFQQLDAIKNVELVFVKEMNSNLNAIAINETVSFKLQGVLDTASYPVHDLTTSLGIGRRVVRVQSFALATMQEVMKAEFLPELFVDKRRLIRFILLCFYVWLLISDIVSDAWYLRNLETFSWSAKAILFNIFIGWLLWTISSFQSGLFIRNLNAFRINTVFLIFSASFENRFLHYSWYVLHIPLGFPKKLVCIWVWRLIGNEYFKWCYQTCSWSLLLLYTVLLFVFSAFPPL